MASWIRARSTNCCWCAGEPERRPVHRAEHDRTRDGTGRGRSRALVKRVLAITALAAALLAGCVSQPMRSTLPTTLHPVRFLLTFDDGPSLQKPYNPTVAVL